MDYDSRQKKLRSAVAKQRLDALLVTHLPNIQYLCGFTGSAAALLITAHETIFFTDGRYTEQARAEVQGAKVVIARKTPLVAAGEWLAGKAKKLRLRTAGIEAQHVNVAERSGLSKTLSSSVRLRECPPLVEQARMVKDPEEIEKLRKAVLLGSSLFEIALRAIRPGIKEVEVAADMEYKARRAGAEAMSFETIIASGPRSALPHGRASEAIIPANGFVVCDFGVILASYCSDMTRTVHVGKLSSEARRIYQAVRDAQQAAVAAVRPGVPVSKVDEAARKLLNKQGLAKYFTHSTGHGVGLEIHEPPRIAAKQNEELKPGMVITVEPGVYIPDLGGVRIEDMVVVNQDGCEVLTPTSKELVVI
ncbi:MAG TPA: Xaa-Pro peptidase family protein [Terriglobales bacterium]|nr:Xaa-Pro peptidase family protein [Terriglobales bacterium]